MNVQSNLIEVADKKLKKANVAMNRAVSLLFGIAILGQLLFVYYIVTFYGGTAVAGEFDKWTEAMHNGFIEGDVIGNFFLMVHIALAAAITFGGPLQFIPQVRKRFPKFHRWNGRIYIVTAFVISLAGLYMVHTRVPIGGRIMTMGNSLNALLIMFFSVKTWRTAMARDFVAHKRWALRAFLVASGVWFFRIGFGLWILLTGGQMFGSTNELTGPFDMFLTFAHTLLPLAILELYFYTKRDAGRWGRIAMTVGLGVMSIALAAAIFMVSQVFWF